jgi:hypothetical protein
MSEGMTDLEVSLLVQMCMLLVFSVIMGVMYAKVNARLRILEGRKKPDFPWSKNGSTWHSRLWLWRR